MFQTKLQRKSKHTFCSQQLFIENRAVYEIMWKNIVERSRPRMTIWHMRIACAILSWITKTTNKHSEYVILFPFLQQKWLHERVSMLHYTYTDCLVQYFPHKL
jgi:hypothetical protein